ncbi:dTDP-fucopyranose mutase [Sorochytrium milnesiophthora]
MDALLAKASANLAKAQKQSKAVKKRKQQSQANAVRPATGKTNADIEPPLYMDPSLTAAIVTKSQVAAPVPSDVDATKPAAASSIGSSSSSQRRLEGSKTQTSGDKWFDLPATPITPEIKRDLLLLRARSALDPKRHYKKDKLYEKELPKYFQIGTIVEAPHEFYSGRMTNKERKQTLVDELLADTDKRRYFKKKFLESQERQFSGSKKWYKMQKELKKKQW